MHEIASGIDTGPIVAQSQVAFDDSDTGETLFKRVREAEKDLFSIYWPKLLCDDLVSSTPQQQGGSYHTKQEFFDMKQGTIWESLGGADLVRLVRCLTFPGYSGLEITLGRRKFELQLAPLYDEGHQGGVRSEQNANDR